ITRDRRWHLMFAGDVANVLPIVRRARAELEVRRSPYRRELVEGAFVGAYKDYREHLVNDGVLGIYNIDLSAWGRTGLKRFGPKEFSRINQHVESVRVGVDFIIYGYDDLN